MLTIEEAVVRLKGFEEELKAKKITKDFWKSEETALKKRAEIRKKIEITTAMDNEKFNLAFSL